MERDVPKLGKRELKQEEEHGCTVVEELQFDEDKLRGIH